LNEAARRHSTATVLFHAALAERLGLGGTDHKTADLIARHGPMTAGDIAELTGLTTGAVTGVLDRLERAGFVRRERDPDDRRRVVVRLVPDSAIMRRAAALFQSLGRSCAVAFADYDDQALALLLDFLRRAEQLMQRETAKLRETAAAEQRPKKGGRKRAPPKRA
jgi:DNA-binding MarR family transcriptional regulator